MFMTYAPDYKLNFVITPKCRSQTRRITQNLFDYVGVPNYIQDR